MIVDLDTLALKSDPIANFTVQDGDELYMQKDPSVSIVGEVLNGATVGFNPEYSICDYIDLAGGLRDSADKNKMFVILPNGKAQLIKKGLFSTNKGILPGSTADFLEI